MALEGGEEEQGEGGEAIAQHDSKGDPQHPACGTTLPVPNGPRCPPLVPSKGSQNPIPCQSFVTVLHSIVTEAAELKL